MHTSQIALDWAGTYEGVLPCADCEGIQTWLTIREDLTYEIETQHLGRSEEVFSRRGTFSWDEQGRTITLQGIDPALETNHYLVGEDRLFKVDEDGKPMLNAHLLERSRRGMEGR
jgi:copper homeostasis protein (lipoprotein)